MDVTKQKHPDFTLGLFFSALLRRQRQLLQHVSYCETYHKDKQSTMIKSLQEKTAIKIHKPISYLLGSHPDKPGPLHLQIKIREDMKP